MNSAGGGDAAEAIRTTDTVAKTSVARRTTADAWMDGRRHGEGRGHACAGPRHDARRPHHRRRGHPASADGVLPAATRVTVERVDSDGCMSTNDTVLLLASGAAGAPPPEDELSTR